MPAPDNRAADVAEADAGHALTTVPGWGLVAMGLTACVAAWIADGQRQPEAQLTTWLVTAVVASQFGIVAAWNKVRRIGVVRFRQLGRRGWLYAAQSGVGAITTLLLVIVDALWALPGAWLLVYGATTFAAGRLSVPPVRHLGAVFVALGVVSLATSVPDNWLLLAGFGVAQLVGGLVIALRHHG